MRKIVENGYLLDTNIVSMLARAKSKNGDVDEACQQVLIRAKLVAGTGNAFICSTTVGEIEYGLRLVSNPDPVVHHEMRAIIESYTIHAIDRHVASDCYAELRARLFKKYAPRDVRGNIKNKWIEEMCDLTTGKELGIQENDLWIVAVAMNNRLTLVTADKMEHLKGIVRSDEVAFENWAE